tara:strand:- start:232 stop:483 length:252 start_codon:yes stop_codon:yes gene_type:complete
MTDLDELLLADGFDKAFVGVVRGAGTPDVAVYNEQKCLEILMDNGMTGEEATEYFEFNVVSAYVGEKTPVFLNIMDIDDVRVS